MPTPGVKCDMRAHARLDEHGVRLSALESEIKAHTVALSENTELTRQVATNTSELVELMKGIKGLRSLVVWGAPLVAAVIALVAYLREFR